MYLGNQGYARITGDHDNATYIYNGAGDAVVWGQNNSRTYLYYDGTGAIYTDAGGGYVVTGSSATSGTLYLGNSGGSFITNQAGTSTYIRNYQADNVIYGQDNSYTYIYYDGNWKARTLTDGLEVNGKLVFNGALAVAGNPSSYGSSGQVLTSNGSSSPTWQDAGGGQWELVQDQTASFSSGSSSQRFDVDAGTLYKFVFRLYAKTSGAYLHLSIKYNGQGNYMTNPSGNTFQALSRQAYRLYYSHSFSGSYGWQSTGAKLHTNEDMPENDGGQGYYQGELWFHKPNDSNISANNSFRTRLWGHMFGGSFVDELYFDATFDDSFNANASGTGSLEKVNFFSSNGSHMGGFIKQFKLTGT